MPAEAHYHYWFIYLLLIALPTFRYTLKNVTTSIGITHESNSQHHQTLCLIKYILADDIILQDGNTVAMETSMLTFAPRHLADAILLPHDEKAPSGLALSLQCH